MESNNIHLKKKSILFKEGQPAGKLYIVSKGSVICLKSSKDRLIPVFVAKEQDIIGESAMKQNGLYTYSTIALTDVELVPVTTEDLNQVMTQAPSWLSDLTNTMIERFHSTAKVMAENRVLHPSIMSEEDFSSSLEIEYKKLLN